MEGVTEPEVTAAAARGKTARFPDLATCVNLEVAETNRVAAKLFAQGVQIYSWNGTAWTFVAPEAALFFANARGEGQIGTHYAGPTWETVSRSKVTGTLVDRCTPDASHIPWLLLRATSSTGPGIFAGATWIQRLNTVGGNPPAAPGTFTGEVARVPYTANYVFYRAR
jgi:hypothetical protein